MSTHPQGGEKHRPGLQRIFSILCFRCVSALLLLTLVLQTIFLFRGSWEIPPPLLTRLHAELHAHGWHAEYDALNFTLPAGISVARPRLSREGESESLVEAEYGQINLAVRHLLRGKVKISQASLYGGTVWCPAPFSPTGAREKILEQTHATFREKNDGWEVHNANGRIHNLTFTASGQIPRLPEREVDPIDWNRLLTIILPRIIRDRDIFARAQNPQLRLRIAPSDLGIGMTIHGEGWADAVDATRDLQILQPRLNGTWTYDGILWQGQQGSFEAARINWKSEATAHGVHGRVLWNPSSEGFNLLPERAELSIASLDNPAEPLTGLQASFVLTAAERVETEFFAFLLDEPVEGKGDLDWHRGNGRLDLLCRLNPTPLLQHQITKDLGLPYEISFDHPILASATARLENWKFVSASGYAHAGQSNIDGVILDRASARAELTADRFFVPEMVLARDDFEAVGSYEVELDRRTYRLFFNGNVLPLHISPWFRDWWTLFWDDFEFPAATLNGDLDIRGVHGDSSQVNIFGNVQGKGFALHGVPFESVHGKLVVAGYFMELFDLHISRTEGSAHGWFQYYFDPATRIFDRIEFDANSNLDPTELARIFGPAGEKTLSDFQFTQPPELRLGGTVHGAPRTDESRVAIKGTINAPLKYHGIELERLTIDAILEAGAWDFRWIVAGLAGGVIQGDARKWQAGDEEKLAFSFLMLDLDLPESLRVISAWQAQNEIEGTPVGDPASVDGRLDLTVEASGLFGDFQSFTGTGSAKIREADLARVHLLGVLSRLLSPTPLGFTSLHFNEADALFEFELDEVKFSSVNLKGPTSEIRANGTYNPAADNIDFSLKLHLMRETRIPFLSLLLSPVLEPLAHALEIRLIGPAADPQWKFLFGARNILSGITGDEMTKTPDTE